MSLEFESVNQSMPEAVVPSSPSRAAEAAPAAQQQPPPAAPESFAEIALRLGGASADEAKRTGVIDSADDQVEELFAQQYQTVNSPIHRAVWGDSVATEWFAPRSFRPSEEVVRVVDRSLGIVRTHRNKQTLVDERGKIAEEVFLDLADAGYWGLLVDRKYGGAGASMRDFSRMITQMATLDPTVAGLASVHGCIGAVDPVRAFGSGSQKQRFLPGLAAGSRLSAFALTEPGAGSDLTALRTTAVRDGDDYVVNGEKLFITNATFGRTIGLVCNIDDVPSVLIVELPESETETFSINRYGLYALRRAENNGLVFRNFRVPVANRLVPDRGDGLTIAYHGLNLGRVALCANAAGTMRWMLAEMLPWAKYRETYGQPIEKRELVRRRIGHLAGMIVACDALTHWCASLLDQGFRGEMECIIAKIFASEAQKEAAIELFMKTHGGRAFLHGHLFGDNVHDFLAPCIYEGEGEMLGMAFFKSLVKHHGKEFFEPIGRTLSDLGVKRPNPLHPGHLWALRRPMARYAGWLAKRSVRGTRWDNEGLDHLRQDRVLFEHIRFAQSYLSRGGVRISSVMRTHQLSLADRQCRMSALSLQIQNAVTVLVTALYASRVDDPLTRSAADVICRELRRRMVGGAATDEDFRLVTKTGARIADEGWAELAGSEAAAPLQPYK